MTLAVSWNGCATGFPPGSLHSLEPRVVPGTSVSRKAGMLSDECASLEQKSQSFHRLEPKMPKAEKKGDITTPRAANNSHAASEQVSV